MVAPAPSAPSRIMTPPPAPKPVANTNNNSSYSKPAPAIAPTSVPVVKALPKTNLGEAAKSKMSNDALKSYQAERANNISPPKNISISTARKDPVFTSTVKSYNSPNEYMNRRTTVIRDYKERYPTSYTYSSTMSPNYGHYDSGFLMGLLIGEMGKTSNNAQFMYANQNQDWYREWRRDVEKKAEENAELKRKLIDMDKEISDLKSNNTEIKVTKLPEGIDPVAAIAPEALIEDDDEGSSFLTYFLFLIVGISVFGAVYFYRKGGK